MAAAVQAVCLPLNKGHQGDSGASEVLESLLAAYRERAPLTARPDRKRLEDSLFRTGFFGLLGVDNVLLGQRVPTQLLAPGPGLAAFERWSREELPVVLSRALSHREALAAYVGWLGARR